MSGDRFTINDQYGIYYITCTVVDWIDVFIRKKYKDCIVNSLNHCIENKGLNIYAWCLMSSHLHIIGNATKAQGLSEILRDFKKYTAQVMIKEMQLAENHESRQEWIMNRLSWQGLTDKRITNFKFWQPDNHAIYIKPTSTQFMKQKIDYIHQNPVVEGIVIEPEHYVYSSAADYSGKKGLVNIQLI